MGTRPALTPMTSPDRLRARMILEAYRLCEAYANPLRHGMALSSSEKNAVTTAARLLRGKP